MSEETRPEQPRLAEDALAPYWTETEYIGGVRAFRGMPPAVLQLLIEGGFIELEGRQNEAPTVAEFAEFGRRYPFVRYHGYATNPDRLDHRVSIEGLEADAPELTSLSYEEWVSFEGAFWRTFRRADEARCSLERGAWCWYG
jgi:hypothetical protein